MPPDAVFVLLLLEGRIIASVEALLYDISQVDVMLALSPTLM